MLKNAPALLALLLSACHQTPALLEERILSVESNLTADYGDPFWNRRQLVDRMAELGVPGLGIAVIDDFEIDWVKAYGERDTATGDPLTTDAMLQAASIGKVLVAAAVLQLVDRGVLDLDADVNDALESWHVPPSALTSKEKVTLRRLLSHSAGVTVSGFRGYSAGEAVPDLLQVLDGTPPANSPPIRVDVVPGSMHRYSGGGYTIVQQLLEDVTGKPLPAHLASSILHPLGMHASTFETPLPAAYERHAATGHRAAGEPIPGRWHTYPEVGSGATLWSTPADLARFAISLMRSYRGDGGQILSPRMTQEMLTPVIEERGLGPTVHDDGGDRVYFMHPGGNEGFRCVLVVYPDRGEGGVIMTNGDGGEALWREVLRSVSLTYGWVT